MSRFKLDSTIEKAWDEFRRKVSKGFPNLTHSKKLQFLNNLNMPPIILPGDIHNKNIKHVCFSKKFRQEMLEKNFIQDKNAIDGDDEGLDLESDSKDLTKEEDSIEKVLVKAKTNNFPVDKEKEIKEKKESGLNGEHKDNEDDNVYLDEGDNNSEVEITY